MRMSKYTIGPSIHEQTAQAYHAYVKSLYKAPDVAPDSQSAPGIKLYVTDLRIVIRCKRDEKQLTTAEAVALCLEYGIDYETFTALLTKRGFALVNEEGVQINVKPRIARAGRRTKAAAEADAHLAANQRQAACADQLLFTRPASDVHEEGTLCPGEKLTPS